MRSLLAVFRSYLSYFRAQMQRRRKAAADDEEDPFIYPHQ